MFIPPLHFTGYVGPFAAYPHATFAIVASTSSDKLALPKWRNSIPTQAPNAPDDDAVAALHQHVTQHGRTILLFSDHASFKAWQINLLQVTP
jgi:hypothetical protein